MSAAPVTIAAMGQLFVEGWAPEYGSPYEADDALADRDKVDETVEVDGPWAPIAGVDDGIEVVALVDGVRRIDARLTIDEPGGPIPGICGSYGVGAVIWDRVRPASTFGEMLIERLGCVRQRAWRSDPGRWPASSTDPSRCRIPTLGR